MPSTPATADMTLPCVRRTPFGFPVVPLEGEEGHQGAHTSPGADTGLGTTLCTTGLYRRCT